MVAISVDWLASLGPVEWLISASSAHTILMGDAMAAFPEAKVVGPEYSMEKFKFAKLMKKVLVAMIGQKNQHPLY